MTDDNEEIFRRAAEHYPLNTGNADWETVRKKMEANPAPDDTTHTPKKRKYRPLLLLLLLLLLSLVIIENKKTVLNILNGQEHPKKIADVQATQDATQQTNKQPGGEQENKINTSAGSTAMSESVSSTKSEDKIKNTVVPEHFAENNNTNTITDQSVNNSTSPTLNTSKNSPAVITHTKNKKRNSIAVVSTSPYEKINNRHNKLGIASKQKTKMDVIAAQPDEIDNIVSKEKNNPVVTETIKEKISSDVKIDIAKEESLEKKPLLVADTARDPVKEIAKAADNVSKKEEKKKKSHQKHFYVGLIGGPDFSAIKLQPVKKTGFSYGIIAGYKLNKRFSVETGFLKDKKSYCSDGKYFSTKKIPIPSYVKIDYVSGDCHMYELPLNVYYRFGKKTNAAWFASTGISSYFMNKETYIFDVTRYGQTYPYKADYKTHDNQFAAVINLSGGYTHRIGRIGDLRVEPYIKLPINKIGTGDLPIQSFGVMIGFTRNLF